MQQHRRLALADVPEQPELVRAAEILRRATRPDDLVVSDQPIVPFLADRRVAGPLVDTARLRFQTGSLDDETVIRELGGRSVAAVVVGRTFADRQEITRYLKARFATQIEVDHVIVYAR